MLHFAIALNALVALAATSVSASNDAYSLDLKCSEGFFPGYIATTMQIGVKPAQFLNVTGSFVHSNWVVSVTLPDETLLVD